MQEKSLAPRVSGKLGLIMNVLSEESRLIACLLLLLVLCESGSYGVYICVRDDTIMP